MGRPSYDTIYMVDDVAFLDPILAHDYGRKVRMSVKTVIDDVGDEPKRDEPVSKVASENASDKKIDQRAAKYKEINQRLGLSKRSRQMNGLIKLQLNQLSSSEAIMEGSYSY